MTTGCFAWDDTASWACPTLGRSSGCASRIQPASRGQVQPLLVLPVPSLESVLRGIAELPDGQSSTLAQLDVELNSSQSIVGRVHELPQKLVQEIVRTSVGQFSVSVNIYARTSGFRHSSARAAAPAKRPAYFGPCGQPDRQRGQDAR